MVCRYSPVLRFLDSLKSRYFVERTILQDVYSVLQDVYSVLQYVYSAGQEASDLYNIILYNMIIFFPFLL